MNRVMDVLSKKIIRMIIMVLALYIIGGILIVYITANNKNYKMDMLDDGWHTNIIKDKDVNIVEKINKINYKDETITFTRKLKKNIKVMYPIVAIEANRCLVDVYIDNKKIQSNYSDVENSIKSNFYVRLPQDYEGKTLKIICTITDEKTNNILDSIYIMSENNYFLYLLRHNMLKHIAGTFMIMLGIILLIISAVVPQKKYELKKLPWIGLIFFIGGIGIYAEFDILSLYINNVYIIENVKYISLLSCAIYMLMMIRSVYTKSKLKKHLGIYTMCICIIYILLIILHNLDICRYSESNGFMVASMLISIVVLICYKYINSRYIISREKIFIKGLIVCYIEIILTIIAYVCGQKAYWPLYGKFHFLIILSTLFCSAMLYYVYVLQYYMHKITEKNVLLHSAYTDYLTGLQNRAKYEEVLEEMKQVELSSIAVMSFDLDNLKQINDKEGHDAGDRYIQIFAKTLKKHLSSYEYLGRIGGDEFMLVAYNKNINITHIIEKLTKTFNEYIKEEEWMDVASYSYGYASGLDEKNAKDIDELIDIADSRLYEYKAINKRKQRIYKARSKKDK